MIVRGIVVYTIVAYCYDVLYRPHVAARDARGYCDVAGKPLLNVGAGTGRSSVRAALLGPTLWGDVNSDLEGSGACTPDNVCQQDAHALPYEDGAFGAVVASHVVEHTERPDAVLGELARVGDRVYALTPLWWCPHTWFHPGHLWYRDRRGRFHRTRHGRANPFARAIRSAI